jgi:hypothetical protein
MRSTKRLVILSLLLAAFRLASAPGLAGEKLGPEPAGTLVGDHGRSRAAAYRALAPGRGGSARLRGQLER